MSLSLDPADPESDTMAKILRVEASSGQKIPQAAKRAVPLSWNYQRHLSEN